MAAQTGKNMFTTTDRNHFGHVFMHVSIVV